ncbi:hypothetical protein BKI52_18320 [marine bacterium AO1-C]|nr:hypothetical protein BKI52_18320 [marine bacterium AO1-C]
MQIIFENEFVTTSFDKNTKIAQNIWQEKSQDLTEEQFKNIFSHIQAAIFSCSATRLIIDVRLFKFVIEPELQEWTSKYVMENYVNNGITRIASILPASIFERVSLQQTFAGDYITKGIQQRQFDNEEQAKEWLLA